MVTRKRTKHVGRQAPARKPRGLLNEGDWLDVMDIDGVWNVARVLGVPSADAVEVTYDGWGDEYDEVVRLDSPRVAPYHTFTSAVKCWVKYLNWPLWPSLVTIRAPGTEDGMKNLGAENRLFVDFLDNASFSKRDRCWQMKGKVRKFEDNYDKKRTESTGMQFEQALLWVLQSDASTKMPKFARGTLPEEYKFSPAESADTVRKNMGDELWFQSFALNRMRHKMSHAYELIGDEENDASSDDSRASMTEEKMVLPEVKVEPPVRPKKQKRSPPVRVELDLGPHEEVEVPLELYPLSSDSSEASTGENEQGGSRPKRRRLRTKRRPEELSVARKGAQKQARHVAAKRIVTPRLTDQRSSAAKSSSRHAKGQVKMAARRSIPPGGGYLNLRPSNFEPVATRSPVISRQADMASDEFEYDDVHQQEDQESDATSDIIMDSIDEKIANAKKVIQELEEEKQYAEEDTLADDLVALVDPNPMPSCDQDLSKLISPSAAKPHRSKSASSKRTLTSPRSSECDASLVLSKTKRSIKGKIKRTSHGRDARREKPDRVVISVGHSPSSGTTTQDAIQSNVEEKEKPSVLRVPKNGESLTKRARPVLQDERAIERGDDEEAQEQQRRFCVMRADKEGKSAESRDKESEVEPSEKAKCSKKTVISMPRRFSEIPPVPTRLSNPMPPMAPPPQFRLSSSGAPSSIALTSPSTAVFSSSKGFSMESWFKRKLTRDFLNGGA